MSNEEKNTNEMNENELWDVLKEPIEGETKAAEPKDKKPKEKATKPDPAPVEKATKAAGAPKRPVTLYTTIALAVVVVVLLIVVAVNGLGGSSGTVSNDTDALKQQIAGLESEKAALEQENENLRSDANDYQMQVQELQDVLIEMSTNTEYLEGNTAIAIGENSDLSKSMVAYEHLINALNAMLVYDEASLKENLDAIEKGQEWDYMSGDAKNAYYMVMEYMEQPYWGMQEG